MLIDILLGFNIAALLWNLFYMITVTLENRELKEERERRERGEK